MNPQNQALDVVRAADENRQRRWGFGPVSCWEQLPEPCECDDPANSDCNLVKELHVDRITFDGVNFRGRFLLPSLGGMLFHRLLEIDTAL